MELADLKAVRKACQGEIEAAIERVLEHGRFISGPEVDELERSLAAFVGVDYCVATASGTVSLELALRALGVGPGDEVVTSPFTFISSAEAIVLTGARPVFVDIDPRTFNLDPERLERSITPATKAVIPVSLYGQVARLERIGEVADRHGVKVIEDGAQSFGARRHGRRSGSFPWVGITSFYPSKTLGCFGEGGALFTGDAELGRRLRSLRNHGEIRKYCHGELGTNGRMDTIQAAILLARLPRLEQELASRNRIGERYNRELGSCCAVPEPDSGNVHVYGQYTVRVADRESFRQRLTERGVPTAVHYPICLHRQPVFRDLGCREGDFPEAERAAREVVSLPLHSYLSLEDQDRVIEGVRSVLAGR